MIWSGARLPTLQLTISHSQHLNSGKPVGTDRYERLVSNQYVVNRDAFKNYEYRSQTRLKSQECRSQVADN